MDPLSLLNFVAGLVGTAGKSIETYNKFYGQNLSPSMTIASFMAQCSCVEFILLQIQNAVTQDPNCVSVLETDGALHRHFTTVFGACQMVFSILNEKLGSLVSGNVGELDATSRKTRLATLWNDEEMKDLLRNIESQANALNLLQTALQMRSNIEIHALLTRPNSVSILDKVTDDASTLLSRGEGLAQSLSMKSTQDSEFVFDGIEFNFDVELVQSSVYQKALKFSWTRSVLRRRLSKGSKAKQDHAMGATEKSNTESKNSDEQTIDLSLGTQKVNTMTITSSWQETLEKQRIFLDEIEILEEQAVQLSIDEIPPPVTTPEISDEPSGLQDNQVIKLLQDMVVEPESLDEKAMELPNPQNEVDLTQKLTSDLAPPAASKMPPSPRTLRSVLKKRLPGTQTKSKNPPPKAKAKRTPTFNPPVFYETWSNTEYNRCGNGVASGQLTPALAEQIKEELNELKKEMTVHPSSRVYTHFF